MAHAAHPTRTVPGILAEARELTRAAHRAAIDRLPRTLRHIAGYHLGWWEADGAPLDGDGEHGGGDPGRSPGRGKAIRPALTLACAAAVGGPGAVPDAIPAAVAVELVHDFSLLHDDVMDRDTIRRGRPAAWTVFGSDQALLAGTALLTVAQHHVAGRAQTVLCETVLEMCDGQSMDLRPGPDQSLTHQLVIAERKTGALFGAACELGAVAAHSPQAAWCRAFGRNLGTAFQIADDLADGWRAPPASREQGRGEARRRIAAAVEHLDHLAHLNPLNHLDAAGTGTAAEDLRLLASAVLTESGRARRISGAHTPEPTEKEIGS